MLEDIYLCDPKNTILFFISKNKKISLFYSNIYKFRLKSCNYSKQI